MYAIRSYYERTEPGRVVRVDHVPKTPVFHEDRFQELFNRQDEQDRPSEPGSTRSVAEGPSAIPERPSNVEIVFDGIRRRGNIVDLDFDRNNFV